MPTIAENEALNFWRDEFLKRGGRMKASEVKPYRVKSAALNIAFRQLTDKMQYGGAYIVKRGNWYEWPGQMD